MKTLFLIFWLIIISKRLFFWTWFWQLKEYHISRVLAHFETRSARKLVLSPLLITKLLLLLGLFYNFALFTQLLVLVYLLEVLATSRSFYNKKLKFPVLTKKMLFLLFFGSCLIALIPGSFWKKSLFDFVIFLLVADVVAPGLFSGLIAFFQPLTFLWQRKLIRKAMKKRQGFKDLSCIGITGSYGKTSTKEFLTSILEHKFKVLKTKEHQNSEVGVSQCILKELNSKHEVFVCEMGAYLKGGIKLLSSIAKPKIGILSGINEQHMATFGSQENIIAAKYELIETLPKDGIAIFNGENKYCLELYKKTKKLKRLSGKRKTIDREPSFLWTEEVKAEKEKVSFKIFCQDGDQAEFSLTLLGEQNIENILLAASCAKELGMSLAEIARACSELKAQEKTMKLRKGIKGIYLIDDSYSANPKGVVSALNYLDKLEGKKIIVMPCLIELGKASIKVHKMIGKRIGEVCDLAIITTEDWFKEIENTAQKAGMKPENILFIKNPKQIFAKIKEFSKKGDVVLLEGRMPTQLIKLLSG